jgi:hypothetical protein
MFVWYFSMNSDPQMNLSRQFVRWDTKRNECLHRWISWAESPVLKKCAKKGGEYPPKNRENLQALPPTLCAGTNKEKSIISDNYQTVRFNPTWPGAAKARYGLPSRSVDPQSSFPGVYKLPLPQSRDREGGWLKGGRGNFILKNTVRYARARGCVTDDRTKSLRMQSVQSS